MVIPDEDKIADYYDYRHQLDQLGADFREVITHPTYSLPFLQSGRLVKVKYGKLDFGWGVVINYQKRVPPKVYFIFYLFHPIEPNQNILSRSEPPNSHTRRGPATRTICRRRTPRLCHRF